MTAALHGLGLSASYAGGPPVLAGVSVLIAAGETLGVIGRSGSGKSTLARLLAGLPPAGARVAGRLRWPGGEASVAGAHRAGLGRRVAWLPQDAQAALHPMLRLGRQVAETLRAAGRPSRAGDVAAALQAVDLEPLLAARYPHQVSGGQAQRAALACALAQGPDVLVVDEPTSALDVDTGTAVLAMLSCQARQHGVALVLVSHDLAAVRQAAQRVIVLDEGRVVEDGPAGAVLGSPRSEAASRLVRADAALRGTSYCSAQAA